MSTPIYNVLYFYWSPHPWFYKNHTKSIESWLLKTFPLNSWQINASLGYIFKKNANLFSSENKMFWELDYHIQFNFFQKVKKLKNVEGFLDEIITYIDNAKRAQADEAQTHLGVC